MCGRHIDNSSDEGDGDELSTNVPTDTNRRLKRLEARVDALREEVGSRRVVTETLTLLNSQGVKRAELTETTDGWFSLLMFDNEGGTRLEVSVEENGVPSFSLYGADGKGRAGLVAMESGVVGLCLYDGRGRPRVALQVSEEGKVTYSCKDDDQ
jgi:hypothetical protein